MVKRKRNRVGQFISSASTYIDPKAGFLEENYFQKVITVFMALFFVLVDSDYGEGVGRNLHAERVADRERLVLVDSPVAFVLGIVVTSHHGEVGCGAVSLERFFSQVNVDVGLDGQDTHQLDDEVTCLGIDDDGFVDIVPQVFTLEGQFSISRCEGCLKV